jgi:hypothetical protein
MHLAVYLIFMVLMAAALAQWEIQIEGKDGWAAKLPCWRKEKGLIVKLSGGRPLTGYHFWMMAFMIMMFHFPFLFTGWTWRKELVAIASLILMFVVEDFLWFVFNPHYGLKKFKKGQIWWHKKWWGPVPDFFLPGIAFAVLMLYFGWPGM